jgi:hypothetical protein
MADGSWLPRSAAGRLLRRDLDDAANHVPDIDIERALGSFREKIRDELPLPSRRRRTWLTTVLPALGIGGAVVAAAALGLHLVAPAPKAVAPSPTAQPPPRVEPPPPRHRGAETEAPGVASAPAAAAVATNGPRPGAPSSAASHAATTRSRATTSRQFSVDEEIQQLVVVRGSLKSSPREALRMAEEGHRQFAGGYLYEEREALAIQALIRVGGAGAGRARAGKFLRRYPESPFRRVIEAALE